MLHILVLSFKIQEKNMSKLSFKDLRALSRALFPSLSLGGKGITSSSLRERIANNDEEALIRIYYVVIEQEMNKETIQMINKAPNIRFFSSLWSNVEWKPLVHYCKEITEMDEYDMAILQLLHETNTHPPLSDMERFVREYPTVSWVVAALFFHPSLMKPLIRSLKDPTSLYHLSFHPSEVLFCASNEEIAEEILSRLHGLRFELFDRTLPLIEEEWLFEWCLKKGAIVTQDTISRAIYLSHKIKPIVLFHPDYSHLVLLVAAREANPMVNTLLKERIFDEKDVYEAAYEAMMYWNWSTFQIIEPYLSLYWKEVFGRMISQRDYGEFIYVNME